jgi:hypothetical protein
MVILGEEIAWVNGTVQYKGDAIQSKRMRGLKKLAIIVLV